MSNSEPTEQQQLTTPDPNQDTSATTATKILPGQNRRGVPADFFLTEVCIHFLKGNCRYTSSEECGYLHQATAQSTAPPQTSSSSMPKYLALSQKRTAGDWTCTGCSFSNFSRRHSCGRCGLTKPNDGEQPSKKAVTVPQQPTTGTTERRFGDRQKTTDNNYNTPTPTAAPFVKRVPVQYVGKDRKDGPYKEIKATAATPVVVTAPVAVTAVAATPPDTAIAATDVADATATVATKATVAKKDDRLLHTAVAFYPASIQSPQSQKPHVKAHGKHHMHSHGGHSHHITSNKKRHHHANPSNSSTHSTTATPALASSNNAEGSDAGQNDQNHALAPRPPYFGWYQPPYHPSSVFPPAHHHPHQFAPPLHDYTTALNPNQQIGVVQSDTTMMLPSTSGNSTSPDTSPQSAVTFITDASIQGKDVIQMYNALVERYHHLEHHNRQLSTELFHLRSHFGHHAGYYPHHPPMYMSPTAASHQLDTTPQLQAQTSSSASAMQHVDLPNAALIAAVPVSTTTTTTATTAPTTTAPTTTTASTATATTATPPRNTQVALTESASVPSAMGSSQASSAQVESTSTSTTTQSTSPTIEVGSTHQIASPQQGPVNQGLGSPAFQPLLGVPLDLLPSSTELHATPHLHGMSTAPHPPMSSPHLDAQPLAVLLGGLGSSAEAQQGQAIAPALEATKQEGDMWPPYFS